ncbi:transforming acidic coiled-coil-containing protein 3-like isoform X2 [Clavelina lepadiformis]|uniref:transforming acidic coiled-coil-containing protein 3-like isoform X2 n=1 Tax=Clavelina lepadiformis TaxID=159417 RepID=UPI0040411527
MDFDNFLEMSPTVVPSSILKPSFNENLIVLQTPIHKNLKVSFQTPGCTPCITVKPPGKYLVSGIVPPSFEESCNDFDEDLRWKERIEVVTKQDHEEYLKYARDFLEEIVNVVAQCQKYPTQVCTLHDNDKENLKPTETAKSEKSLGRSEKPNLLHQKQLSSSQKSDCDVLSARGSYNVDDIDLENYNPFQSKKSLENSPPSFSKITEKKISDVAFEKSVKSETESFDNKPSLIQMLSNLPPGMEPNGLLQKKSEYLQENMAEETLDFPEDDTFKDASTLIKQGFDFDLNYGNEAVTSDLRKQSLYMKFDPLVGGDDHATRSMIGRKSDIIDLCGRVRSPRSMKPLISEAELLENVKPDLLCDSPSKFIQEMDSQKTERRVSSSEVVENQVEVDNDIVQVLKYSAADVEKLQKPLLDKIALLQRQREDEADKNSKMQIVLQEYEKTLEELMLKSCEEKEGNMEENNKLASENEKIQGHLERVEKAYLELLQRCEQMKVAIGNYKANEDAYKKAFSEYQSSQEASEQRYKALKATMEANEKKLQDECQKREQEHKSQLTALTARCKFLDNQIKSVHSQLEQKTAENNELTKICDELIEQQTKP